MLLACIAAYAALAARKLGESSAAPTSFIHTRFPTLGNLLFDAGLGPMTLADLFLRGLPPPPPPLRWGERPWLVIESAALALTLRRASRTGSRLDREAFALLSSFPAFLIRSLARARWRQTFGSRRMGAVEKAQSPAAIEVRPVSNKKEQEVFLHVPWTLGAKKDPNWIPPLLDDYRRSLDPKKSPFLQHGEIQCFVAFESGAPVGRISAHLDRDFDKQWPEEKGVAFFGFFDSKDDPVVARALFSAAEAWAKSKGRTRIRGPFTLDSKGEVGVLIDGYDTPPRIGMPHNWPYVGPLVEGAGYAKAKDFFAWWYTSGQVDERTRRIAERTLKLPNVRVRPMDLKEFRREVDIVRDIYNSAWNQNWNFTPFTAEELAIIAVEYKMFIDTEIALVAEVDGKPAAMCFAIPDVNELTRDFDGELMRRPLNLLRLLWRLKFRRPKHARLVLLGVKEEFRASHKYGTLAAVLYVEVATRGAKRGYVGGELGWTLEDNVMINRGIERMGAKKYKTYRVYEKAI